MLEFLDIFYVADETDTSDANLCDTFEGNDFDWVFGPYGVTVTESQSDHPDVLFFPYTSFHHTRVSELGGASG